MSFSVSVVFVLFKMYWLSRWIVIQRRPVDEFYLYLFECPTIIIGLAHSIIAIAKDKR
ncbi:hypothetical protein DFA_04038 [Cavenderia fasciculata]|uniref:Transmembrane protein n=1 Tax=Cavenderia fasciculata TaxID=261658 RepID=F4Q143_CACFS|nr:uncharacterized protein DFA_04038 [Cavenderia fasciculata]EGG18544.1 hypothetical protein DFA_04038 [Cavenderia fasciculata]|eukprot:XP_004366448.1 hypothetical protein DFA_04038 [Cavenderia fasciculata]